MPLEKVEDVYPLTALQSGILFHCIAAHASDVYVTQISCEILADLDVALFRESWRLIVAKHTALRTVFVWDGVDEPLQVVSQQVEIDIHVLDCRDDTESAQQRRIKAQEATDKGSRFELTKAPLMRLSLIRTGANHFRFIWTIHHLISDGWSVATILADVTRQYRALESGAHHDSSRGRPFSEYVKWLLEKGRTDITFWQDYLSGCTEPCLMKALGGNADDPLRQSYSTSEYQFEAVASDALNEFARELRVTPSTLVHAAWSIVVSRYLDRADVVFGTTQSGRPTELPGVEQMVGPFINTVPVRVDTSGSMPLREWLKLLQTNLLTLRQHQFAALTEVARHSEISSGEKLFDSIVVYENYPSPQNDTSSSFQIERIHQTEHSNYPLALLAIPGERLSLSLVYDRREFPGELAKQIITNTAFVLSEFIRAPNLPVSAVGVLPSEDEADIIERFNRSATPIVIDRPIPALIADHVQLNPTMTAVKCNDSSLSYAELDITSTRIAAALTKERIGPGDFVAIFLERDVSLVSAILGVLKSGAAYLPLDPEYPENRLRFMLADARPKAVITSTELASNLQTWNGRIIDIELAEAGGDDPALEPPPIQISLDDAAYVIYTSGSTGQPKGVVVSHRSLSYSTLARSHYYPEAPGVFLMMSPIAFDSSVAGLFWTLSEGGTLVISERRLEQDLELFTMRILESSVSHMLCLPSLLNVLVEHGNHYALSSLRSVILAGEVFPAGGKLEQLRNALPKTSFFNEYGPTEATVWCTVFDTSGHDPSSVVPIGQPIPNAKVYLLDSRRKPVPTGIPGEIYVGGPGLALGYLNNQTLTDERFLPDPFSKEQNARMYRTGDLGRYRLDGQIEFLGRRDQQVKIQGHRIELGEIEAVLSGHPKISEAIAVVDAQPHEQKPIATDPENLLDRLRQLSVEEAELVLGELESLASNGHWGA